MKKLALFVVFFSLFCLSSCGDPEYREKIKTPQDGYVASSFSGATDWITISSS